jgi:hypothetical protein
MYGIAIMPMPQLHLINVTTAPQRDIVFLPPPFGPPTAPFPFAILKLTPSTLVVRLSHELTHTRSPSHSAQSLRDHHTSRTQPTQLPALFARYPSSTTLK